MPRGGGGMGGGDQKPKGRTTAYAFFIQTCREEHKRKRPNEKVIFTEFARKCADSWKSMSDREKKRFQDMADRDKRRYESEMSNYVPPKGSGSKKRRKDPNAPKRSLSAFFWFCQEGRDRIKAMHPEYKVGDISKELGRLWAEVDPISKQRYAQMAERDKQRYDQEMAAYKSRG